MTGFDDVKRSMQDADNRRVELCSALGIDTDTGWSDAMSELDKRLMPPGMEWPRYEDGGPVVLNEFDQNPETISCVAFVHHEAMVDYDSPFVEINPKLIQTSGTTIMNIGERVKRQKQDPIGADHLPIKKGDTVFGTETGCELIVDGFVEDGSHGPYTVDCHLVNGGEQGYYMPNKLTHTKPEPPDSWERLEEDSKENPFDYCKKVGHHLFTFDNAEEFKSLDLVRRAKALAERDA